MTYTLISESNNVTRDSDGATIYDNLGNIDWLLYQSWLAAGNIPNPVPGTPVSNTPIVNSSPIVPSNVALWQAKAILEESGLLNEADVAIASENNVILNSYWNSAANLDRTSPTLASLANTLNLTSSQVDTMFIEAANLTL